MKKLVLITIFLGIELLANNISKEDLGKALFFDVNLSKNRTQSCATCHNPEAAFIDDRDNGVSKMASLGDDLKSLCDRQAQTASYAKFSPDFHFNAKKINYSKIIIAAPSRPHAHRPASL